MPMRFILTTLCCVVLGAAGAVAQSGGGGGGGSAGGASSGASSRGGGPASSAPGSTSPGTVTPGLTPAPGSTTIPRSPAPGVANTPIDPQRNNVDANPPTQRLPGTTANIPNGSLQPGASSPTVPGNTSYSGGGRPDPGGANSSPNSAGAGKNAAQAAVADCVGLWDKGTHMTKAEWLNTCRRIEGRLDNLKVDGTVPKTASKRQRSAGTNTD